MYVLFLEACSVQRLHSYVFPCRILWIVPIYSIDAVSRPQVVQMGSVHALYNLQFVMTHLSLTQSPATPCTLTFAHPLVHFYSISLCLHPTLILTYLSPSPSPLTNPSPTPPHSPLTHPHPHPLPLPTPHSHLSPAPH